MIEMKHGPYLGLWTGRTLWGDVFVKTRMARRNQPYEDWGGVFCTERIPIAEGSTPGTMLA